MLLAVLFVCETIGKQGGGFAPVALPIALGSQAEGRVVGAGQTAPQSGPTNDQRKLGMAEDLGHGRLSLVVPLVIEQN